MSLRAAVMSAGGVERCSAKLWHMLGADAPSVSTVRRWIRGEVEPDCAQLRALELLTGQELYRALTERVDVRHARLVEQAIVGQ